VTPWAEIVGAAHVRPGGAADAVDGVVPRAVVRPGTVDEVRACVRAAAGAGAALLARGLGAHLDVGAPPARLDVLLDVARLARVLDHRAGDMTVTVEAGCPLPALADVLAGAGQWLPLDPPRAGRTTVGGLVAAGLFGPLRASQGRVRDLLLGVRVVGADGALVAGGGRVVKNVAGYDLPKLHVGALGTLGVLVEATFKVRPRPPCGRALVAACGDVGAAADLALAARDAAVEPFWLVLEGERVSVGFAGVAEEVAAGAAAMRALAERRGARVADVDPVAARGRAADMPGEPAAAVLRAGVLPGDVGAALRDIDAAARAAGTAVRTLAHVACGVVYAAVAAEAPVPRLVAHLRPRMEARGGSLVVERAAPGVKRALDVWGDPGPGLPLMRGVKAALDPGALFAPGRFVGGL